MTENITTVIFDLDGTIIDTEKYYRIFWPKVLGEFGYSISDEEVLALRSLGRPFAPARFQEMYGKDFDYWKVRNRRKEQMEEFFETHPIELKPGAVELLAYLKEHGICTAIATANDLERASKYLKRLDLGQYFDHVITATMVKAGKPSPDIYLYACGQLGKKPQECFAVEDAPNGIISAFRAGCKVIMVPDQSQPDRDLEKIIYKKVNRLDEIIDIFEK